MPRLSFLKGHRVKAFQQPTKESEPYSDMTHSYTARISQCQERRWTGQGTHRRFGTNDYSL